MTHSELIISLTRRAGCRQYRWKLKRQSLFDHLGASVAGTGTFTIPMPKHEDPAERTGYLRYFYRGWRPTRLGRIWNRAYAWVSGLGLVPHLLVTLQTKDRNSGRDCANILVVATYQGKRYLVSMLGDGSEWVQNVRAAGGKASIRRGRSQPILLAEIPPSERASILKAWCQVATSGRKHLPVPYDAPVSDFEAIAGDYPVFRIDRVA
jgi:hypothetical protein